MAGVALQNVMKQFGDVKVIHGIDLKIEDGEFCVFVGPSGCGKSTLLRMVAGLEDTSAGAIHIGAKDVTKVDPAERGVAMVFQTYALYPHMTVAENMGFGLKMTGHPKEEVASKVKEASRILKLDEYLSRKPKALSGGQRQRVAIGRAIVRGPQVFLFDEPLSNLDAELRVEMRVEIARLHRELGATMIYVTHDQVEAMTLADKIVVLRKGRIEQVGAPLELYQNPDNRFVAGFIGSPEINFLDGLLESKAFHTGDVSMDVSRYPFVKWPAGPAWFGIRPEAVLTGDAAKACPVHMDSIVEIVEPMGADTLVWTKVAGQDFRLRMEGQARVAPGDALHIGFDPIRASMFDKGTEERL